MAITLNGTTGITTDIDGDESLTLNRDTSNGDIIVLQKDNSTIGHIGVEAGDNFYIADQAGNCGINFKGFINPVGSNGETRDNAIDLGNSSGRFNDLYLGGGVYVGGTGSANYLDDYEVGTYTTTATPLGGGTVTLNSSYNKLGYIKIGDLVFISGMIVISSVSSPSGNLRLQLPFTVKNNTSGLSSRTAGTCQVYDSSASNSIYLGRIAFAGDSTFNINSSSANTPNITWAASDEVIVGFCYQAS